MKYKVDGWSNFCRIFELPLEFSSEFCFGGGIPTNFTMVDWFNPIPIDTISDDDISLPNPAVEKEEWEKNVGKIKVVEVDEDWIREKVVSWLMDKVYLRPGRKYLIICDFGASVIFQKGEANG